MDDESLFALHARFKAGDEVPDAWYREGEVLGEDAWAVDLDVFLEIEMPRASWEELRGETLELELGEVALAFELPEETDFDEVWTLPGSGLFEPAPGVTEAQLAEAEEIGEDDELGRFGDLHLIPVVTSPA